MPKLNKFLVIVPDKKPKKDNRKPNPDSAVLKKFRKIVREGKG